MGNKTMQEYEDILAFDRLIHEPSRLVIMAVLSSCESADFTYMLNATKLSRGNLSAHIKKLKDGGYVDVAKSFKGNYPNTSYTLTKTGRAAFAAYRKQYLKVAHNFNEE
jgi:DNA-binding transcriptional ArsR family regulator